jgi:hypothetical protein
MNVTLARLVIPLVAAVGPTPVLAAVGTVDLSWNSCAPIVVNRNFGGANPYLIFGSISGHDEPNMGYELRIVLGTALETTPDAWQFERDGCQGHQRFEFDHLPTPEVAGACPAFQGDGRSLQIKAFDTSAPQEGPYSPNLRRMWLVNVYPDVVTPSAGTRYFLARFQFDHLFSVTGPAYPGLTCGGLEESMCFVLTSARWLDSRLLTLDLGLGQSFLTFNNSGNSIGCPTVPVRNRTWGSIKSQYRM